MDSLIQRYCQSLPPKEECDRVFFNINEYFFNYMRLFKKQLSIQEVVDGYQSYVNEFLKCVWLRFLVSWYRHNEFYREKEDDDEGKNRECPIPENYGVSLEKDIIDMIKKKETETKDEYDRRSYLMLLQTGSLLKDIEKKSYVYFMTLK